MNPAPDFTSRSQLQAHFSQAGKGAEGHITAQKPHVLPGNQRSSKSTFLPKLAKAWELGTGARGMEGFLPLPSPAQEIGLPTSNQVSSQLFWRGC